MKLNLNKSLPSTLFFLTAALFLFALTSCGGGGGSSTEDGIENRSADTEDQRASIATLGTLTLDSSSGRSSLQFAGESNSEGISSIPLRFTGTDSFQLILESDTRFAAYEFKREGEVLVSSTQRPLPTTSVTFDSLVNSFPYPTLSRDPLIDESGTYFYSVLFQDRSGHHFRGTLVGKRDSNPNGGILRVTIHLVGAYAQSDSARSVIERAIQIWSEIFSTAGISMRLHYAFHESATGILPNPRQGSSFYYAASSASGIERYGLNLFIGESIALSSSSASNGEEFLGLSSAIPGPAVPTEKSASTVGLSGHAGPDGAFSEEEIAILGETFAHEAGHYLGLFHPVELSGGSEFSGRDPLGDTPVCRSEQECIDLGVALNTMFPKPIRGLSQRSLSNEQRSVLNSQVLVD